jgi:hypothetical protein
MICFHVYRWGPAPLPAKLNILFRFLVVYVYIAAASLNGDTHDATAALLDF